MELRDFKKQYEDFAYQTDAARRLALRDRDYVDHKQWTADEVAELRRRKQKPVVINKIKKKHNFLMGLEIRGRMDPKAYPRTPQHEQDADAITDALRYIADNQDLDHLFSDCFDEYLCEGDEAVIIEVSGKNKDIKPRQVNWDRFYYDPHRRRKDFADAKYLGISIWIDRKDLERMFPEKADQIAAMGDTTALEDSFEDRPKWFDRVGSKRDRVRFNEHYYLDGGEWKLVFFAGDTILQEPEDSPFLDCDGAPTCPIIAQSAYVDRENASYGVVRGDISIQEEINSRRSKALHMLSSKTVITEKGMVDSATAVMQKLKSGDGYVELNRDGRFEVDGNQELSSGQLAMYQDAKIEMDESVVSTMGQGGSESGRSKLVDRENDSDELARVFDGHRSFKLRVWRQVWAAVKQFWTEERWVRVTDDEQNVKFVGLNRKVTGRDVVAERYGLQAGDVDQFLMQEGIGLMPGQLDRVVSVENQVSQMDVDIILSESPDVITIQQEQFEVIARLAEVYGPEHVPFEEILKLSSLRNKNEFLERTKGDADMQQMAQQQALQTQQANAEMEMQSKQAGIAKDIATAAEKNARTEQIRTETQLALFGEEKIG